MITRSVCLLIVICLVTIVGCHILPTPGPTPGPNTEDGDLEACRELVRSHNAPLIIAVRVAITKATGTPVEAMETTKNGQTVYRVLIKSQSSKPTPIAVSQSEVDGEKIPDPSSVDDCRALDESKVAKIITAMRLARNNVPGKLVKAKFTEYEGYFVYSVTIQDSAGKNHEVQVESDRMKIVSPQLVACKELVKSHNAPLIVAVRVAMPNNATDIPVEAMETTKSGQTVYRVLIQGQSGKPKTIDVSQRMVDGEKITDPSSVDDCRALDESKVAKIITAMRIARNNVPGRLVKAKFMEYKGYFVYSVTIQDSAGKNHEVQVDSDRMIILNPTGVGH